MEAAAHSHTEGGGGSVLTWRMEDDAAQQHNYYSSAGTIGLLVGTHWFLLLVRR